MKKKELKEEWISTREFARRTGKTLNSIYVLISLHREKDKDFSKKFKKSGNQRLINISWFTRREEKNKYLQERFEKAYFSLLDLYEEEHLFAGLLSKQLSVHKNTVMMYFRDCFVVDGTRVTSRRKEYVEAMEKIIEKNSAINAIVA